MKRAGISLSIRRPRAVMRTAASFRRGRRSGKGGRTIHAASSLSRLRRCGGRLRRFCWSSIRRRLRRSRRSCWRVCRRRCGRFLFFRRGALANVAQIRTHPFLSEQHRPIKKIIARRAAALAPFAIDIRGRVIGTKLLAVAINAAVRGVNAPALFGHS